MFFFLHQPMQEDLQERAGPFGHLYYLLDPADNHSHLNPSPSGNPKPPLPTHLPPTSPAHKVNSLASNNLQTGKKHFSKKLRARSLGAGDNNSDSSSATSC